MAIGLTIFWGNNCPFFENRHPYLRKKTGRSDVKLPKITVFIYALLLNHTINQKRIETKYEK